MEGCNGLSTAPVANLAHDDKIFSSNVVLAKHAHNKLHIPILTTHISLSLERLIPPHCQMK